MYLEFFTKCNEIDDCGDNSDEIRCNYCFEYDSFYCHYMNCIRFNKMCDGINYCGNNSDESRRSAYCTHGAYQFHNKK